MELAVLVLDRVFHRRGDDAISGGRMWQYGIWARPRLNWCLR